VDIVIRLDSDQGGADTRLLELRGERARIGSIGEGGIAPGDTPADRINGIMGDPCSPYRERSDARLSIRGDDLCWRIPAILC